jgi:hypothetical protein
MAEYTPVIIPLGSLAEAAAASAEMSQLEGWANPEEPGTLTGAVGPSIPWD